MRWFLFDKYTLKYHDWYEIKDETQFLYELGICEGVLQLKMIVKSTPKYTMAYEQEFKKEAFQKLKMLILDDTINEYIDNL